MNTSCNLLLFIIILPFLLCCSYYKSEVNGQCNDIVSLVSQLNEIDEAGNGFSFELMFKGNQSLPYGIRFINNDSVNFDVSPYTYLSEVSLNGSHLQAFDFYGNTNITSARISNCVCNNLLDFKSLEGLMFLSISNNRMINDSINISGINYRLIWLDISNNRLRNFKITNSEQLNLLTYIDITNNNIEIPDESFYQLKSLTYIDARGNPNIKLNINMFPELKVIKIDSSFVISADDEEYIDQNGIQVIR